MGSRFFVFALALALPTAIPAELFAQDVPGIEICTVEKAMDRRTSCLQSNVDFLQKTVADLQAAQKQLADEVKKPDVQPAKGAEAPAKGSTK